jgi:hypothetical protein
MELPQELPVQPALAQRELVLVERPALLDASAQLSPLLPSLQHPP